MQKYVVATGQKVTQGTTIGYVGSTGYSTGPHLHFSVYKNSKLIDPMTVLK
jgi:murein DD-endopeptidase MepM/ murein hydrolase activator NlpD